MKLYFPILLICCGVLLVYYNHFFADWEKKRHQKATERFDQLVAEQKKDLIDWSNEWESNPIFSKQMICKAEVVRWSDNHPFPIINIQKEIDFIDTTTGTYLCQIVRKNTCVYVSIYRMVNKYPITNRYLADGISDYIHPSVKSISLFEDEINYKGLFSYSMKVKQNKMLDSIAVLCLIIAFFYVYGLLARKNRFYFWMVTSTTVTIWILNLKLGLIAKWTPYQLFNRIYYSSSFLNSSLGELVLSCLLLLYVVVLFNRHYKHVKPTKWSIFLTSFTGISLMSLVYYLGWDIMDNSQISLDIGETLELDTLRIVGWLSILLLGLIYLHVLFYLIHTVKQSKLYRYCIIGTSLAFLGLLFNDPSSILPGGFHFFLLFLLFKFFGITVGRSPQQTHLILICWVSIGLAASLSYGLYKHYELDELNAKKKFANHLVLKRDILGEYYIHQALLDLEQLNFEETANIEEKLFQKIKKNFSNPYFQNYELMLKERESLAIKFVSTEYTNIAFIDDDSFVGYLCNLPDKWRKFVLLLRLNKHIPPAVFPALLTDDKYYNLEESYDYAIIENNKMIHQKSKFGHSLQLNSTDLENELLYNIGIETDNKHYLGIKTAKGNILLIVSKLYPTKNLISNFCFLALLLITVFNGYFFFKDFFYRKQKPLGFGVKLQLCMAFVLIIPLLVTGISLLSLLYTSYKNEINRNYLKKSLYISEMLSDISSRSQSLYLKDRMSEISGFVKADISYYNKSGNLLASSQPNIFNLGLQSHRINPIVFNHLVEKENLSIITEEAIGILEYKVCYARIAGKGNAAEGFIAMPFFDSKNHLKRQQIEVFGSIISIFGLIVILYILFGNLVLRNLLLPLHMVAAKIREITLQEENEPIRYHADDDIGSLVKDYNQMLVKLETSKKALAKSQKEQVWKQIARQVAHEIKNPLTPMQLKIQQLLRNKEKNDKEEKILHSLLEQIATLSQIATSFSAFAEMPVPVNAVFDLSELVLDTVHFHRSKSITIKTDIQSNTLIYADKNIFRRILNNLILNAIQSVDKKKQPELEIKLSMINEKVTLSVKDNGKGISEQLKDKIFFYQFSTKSTGSGIGLALAKKGIENVDGNIWFESESGKGTIFYITLPVVS